MGGLLAPGFRSVAAGRPQPEVRSGPPARSTWLRARARGHSETRSARLRRNGGVAGRRPVAPVSSDVKPRAERHPGVEMRPRERRGPALRRRRVCERDRSGSSSVHFMGRPGGGPDRDGAGDATRRKSWRGVRVGPRGERSAADAVSGGRSTSSNPERRGTKSALPGARDGHLARVCSRRPGCAEVQRDQRADGPPRTHPELRGVVAAVHTGAIGPAGAYVREGSTSERRAEASPIAAAGSLPGEAIHGRSRRRGRARLRLESPTRRTSP
jgi:hypothetical protein